MVILPHRRSHFRQEAGSSASTLLNSLWAWYDLNELLGDAIDSSGNSRDMTADTSIATELGTAPDGGNCRYRITTPSIFLERLNVNFFPGNVTIGYWFNVAAISGRGNIFLTGDAAELNLAIMPRSTTISRLYTNNGLTNVPYTAAAFGSWMCFIVTWDGTDAVLWVNGVKLSTVRSVAPAVTTTGKLRVESQNTGDRYCSCGIWDRVLSDPECVEFYNSGVNLRYADLT